MRIFVVIVILMLFVLTIPNTSMNILEVIQGIAVTVAPQTQRVSERIAQVKHLVMMMTPSASMAGHMTLPSTTAAELKNALRLIVKLEHNHALSAPASAFLTMMLI